MIKVMDKSELEAKKLLAETTYNQLQSERDQHVKRVQEIDDEQKRLQGEHRLLNGILNPPEPEVFETDDPAQTISVKPKKVKSNVN